MNVTLEMDELDVTSVESKATYEEIKEYVLEKHGLRVTNLYIAQVKRKCGIIERENYNKSKSEVAKQTQCPEERYLLKEVNAVFPKGRLCYLMGKSGEGKSTLINLLLGFLEAESGAVLYDNRSIGELLREKRLTDYISWVPQEPILFSDTIRNNLLLGKEIEDGRLQEICKKCALYEDIQKMPAGLETEIGENGEGLSVGQKHRLGMARAFLQEKPIIIIDEGTAGLDAETELVIKQYLQELCQNKITIIITHSKQLLLENAMVYELKAGHLSLKEDMND